MALEPNLLAHAHLATLDLPVTALWWGALWAWRYALTATPPAGIRSHARLGIGFALVAAAAVLTKFTGLLLFPAVWIAAVVARPGGATFRRATIALALAAVVTYLLSHLAYGFGPIERGLPAALWNGLAGKMVHRDEVHFAYLAGHRSQTGFLTYYGLALLLKTPLPLWIFAGVGAVVLWRRRMRLDLALLVVPAVVVVVAFTLLRVNIGVRHVLPVYPALLLLAATGIVTLLRRGHVGQIAVAALVVVWMAGVARIAPQWLAYFNVLAGGPAGGHRWLLDSNLDWGQDDARLARHLAASAARGEVWDVDPDPEQPRTGRFVVSANALHNLQRRSDRPYFWLRDIAPRGHAGWSQHLYVVQAADYAAQLERAPRSPAAAAAYAEILSAQGDSSRAGDILEQTAQRLAGRGELVDLAVYAAQAAARRHDWRRAQGWTARGLQQHPDDLELQGLAHDYQLEAELAAAGEPHAAARAAFELGLWRAETGRIAAALPLLRQAAAGLPDDSEAQRVYAVGLARQGDYAAASAVLAQEGIRGKFPEEEALCTTLAAARRDLDRGASVEPALLHEIGRVAFEAERYDVAAAAFARSLERDPRDALALAHLGEMQVRVKMRLVATPLAPRAIVPLHGPGGTVARGGGRAP
jgi:tetratricopeptide (TPR) repeat protein